MRKIYLLAALITLGSCSDKKSANGDYPYTNVPFTQVHFDDSFWTDRIETSRTVTIPEAFLKCEETERVDNFAKAAGLMEGAFDTPYPFDDTDLYKIIEGGSFLLSVKPDPALDRYMDSIITLIGAAQEEDGYLYTTRTIGKNVHPWAGPERWSREWDNSHELYNAGHMYEAAVAHYLATGKRNFLDIAIKNADLIDRTFGPGKLEIAPGHQIIETGLVKLYRATGDRRYLDLSKFMLESRGKRQHKDPNSQDQWQNGQYWQDHLPVTQQFEAVGHAVRALYMYSGMTDIAALTGDKDYLSAIDSLWENVVGKKMYITGGIGSTSHGEAFGKNYELPNGTAYCETCAAIANCMWNERMFMLYGDAKYIDVLELSLYNAVLSGVSLDGDSYFYPNPLEISAAGRERSKWFDCSCCPSNIARFIPSVPGYVYGTSGNDIYVNLYGSNDATINLPSGQMVFLNQETDYPWGGKVKIDVAPASDEKFTLRLRIPGWSQGEIVPSDLYKIDNPSGRSAKITVDGKEYKYRVEKGYAVIKHKWTANSVVEMELPMQVNKISANPLVEADKDKLAYSYGPIVYCAEFADNNDPVSSLVVPADAAFEVSFRNDELRGVDVLTTEGSSYKIANPAKTINNGKTEVNLIPFYAHAHRGAGEMAVWLWKTPEPIIARLESEKAVLDQVLIGNSLSEKEHALKGERTNSGVYGSRNWRDAVRGGWFSYDLAVDPDKENTLILTYLSADGGNRTFDILVDGEKIASQRLRSETFVDFIDRAYPIPAALTKGKKKVTVKLQAIPDNTAGGLFGMKTSLASK